MRKTKTDTEISKRLILDAAYKVFLRNGYSATKMSDIADEIKMTRGVIYWHFKNKTELFVSLLDEIVDQTFNRATEIFLSQESLQDKLKILLVKDDSGTPLFELLKSFHPHSKEVDSKTRNATIKAILKKVQLKFDFFIELLNNEQKAGHIRKNIDIQAFGVTFIMVASLLHAPFECDPKIPLSSIRSFKNDEIINILWNGFGSVFVNESGVQG